MISVSKFNQICKNIKQAVPGFAGVAVVVHEEHARKRLSDCRGIWLVAIVPSSDREGSQGSGVDRNVTWFFVVEKDDSSQSIDQEMAQYEKTQELILQVREYIEEQHADGIPHFSLYQPSSAKIDPEYREFGGWNGWSMSLTF